MVAVSQKVSHRESSRTREKERKRESWKKRTCWIPRATSGLCLRSSRPDLKKNSERPCNFRNPSRPHRCSWTIDFVSSSKLRLIIGQFGTVHVSDFVRTRSKEEGSRKRERTKKERKVRKRKKIGGDDRSYHRSRSRDLSPEL